MKVMKMSEGDLSSGAWDAYNSDGELENKSCPKCGEGNFLAEHDDRRVCGKCGYVEMKE